MKSYRELSNGIPDDGVIELRDPPEDVVRVKQENVPMACDEPGSECQCLHTAPHLLSEAVEPVNSPFAPRQPRKHLRQDDQGALKLSVTVADVRDLRLPRVLYTHEMCRQRLRLVCLPGTHDLKTSRRIWSVLPHNPV